MSIEYPSPSELFNLRDDVAVITGGGRGIGEGIGKLSIWVNNAGGCQPACR